MASRPVTEIDPEACIWDVIHKGGLKYKRISIPNGHKINLRNKLGGGDNGVTYETDNGRALKIVNLNSITEKTTAFINESIAQQTISRIQNVSTTDELTHRSTTGEPSIGGNTIAPHVYLYYPSSITQSSKYGYLLMDKITPINKYPYLDD